MESYNKYIIEDVLSDIIKRKIKSFYIEYFAKFLSIDISTALFYLNKFSKESDKIKIMYEVRCLDCLDIVREYEHIEDIEIGSLIECENCGNEEDEITLELSNIYIKYYINEDWWNYVRQKQNFKNKSNKINSSPNIPPSEMHYLENGSLSMQNLKDMNILDCVLKDRHIETINIYVNNGNAGAMGEKSTTFDADFNGKENIYDRKLYQ